MKIYEVPKEERKRLLTEIMASDYRSRGDHVFEAFYGFVDDKIIQSHNIKH